MVNRLLGILLETSSPHGSLALCSLKYEKKNLRSESSLQNCQLIEYHSWDGPAHSSYITQKFDKILQTLNNPLVLKKKLGSDFTKESMKISFVALGIGPGRFTGVRVGVSFARAVAFSYNVPIFPVSSLKILAESQIHQGKPVLVLINAFKNSMYAAIYQKQEHEEVKELLSPCVILPEELHLYVKQENMCVGDGYEVYKTFFSKELDQKLSVCSDSLFPDVKSMVPIMGREFQIDKCLHWKQVQPVYLRSPVTLLKSDN